MVQPCIWFMEEPSQFSTGQTAQILTCFLFGETTYRVRLMSENTTLALSSKELWFPFHVGWRQRPTYENILLHSMNLLIFVHFMMTHLCHSRRIARASFSFVPFMSIPRDANSACSSVAERPRDEDPEVVAGAPPVGSTCAASTRGSGDSSGVDSVREEPS